MIERIKEFLNAFISALIAIIRLFFLAVGLIASGLHIILFNRMEICNIEMKGLAWRCDREKDMQNMAFIDKMVLENPDLLDYADGQVPDDDPNLPKYYNEDNKEEDEGNDE